MSTPEIQRHLDPKVEIENCAEERPSPTFAQCINRVFIGSQIYSTQLQAGVLPGSISALHAPSVITKFLSDDSRWQALASSSTSSGDFAHRLVLPKGSSEAPIVTDNPVSANILIYARVALKHDMHDYLPSLWSRLLRSALFIAHAAQTNPLDQASKILVDGIQHVEAWSNYLASITQPKSSSPADVVVTVPSTAVRHCTIDTEKSLGKSTRSELNIPCEGSATISYGFTLNPKP